MKEQPIQYLSDKISKAEQIAFQTGCRAMLTLFRNTPIDQHPYLWSSVSKQHITAILTEYGDQISAQRDKEAHILLSHATFDKSTLRAFLFDVIAINDYGQEINPDTGEPIETSFFVKNTDSCNHQPYGNRQAIHMGTGETIKIHSYAKLPPHIQPEYEIVRYLDIKVNGVVSLSVGSNDRALMSELIRQDILVNDPLINYRYLLAMADGGVLEEYRNVIAEALLSLGDKTDISPVLVNHAKQGIIHTNGHFLLAQFESISENVKPINLINALNPATIDAWLSVFESFSGDQSAPSPYITDEDFVTYRSINRIPLRSAINAGTDEDPRWMIRVSCKESDDPTDRYNYFKHFLLPQLYERLSVLLERIIADDSVEHLYLRASGHVVKLAQFLIDHIESKSKYPRVSLFTLQHNISEPNP